MLRKPGQQEEIVRAVGHRLGVPARTNGSVHMSPFAAADRILREGVEIMSKFTLVQIVAALIVLTVPTDPAA